MSGSRCSNRQGGEEQHHGHVAPPGKRIRQERGTGELVGIPHRKVARTQPLSEESVPGIVLRSSVHPHRRGGTHEGPAHYGCQQYQQEYREGIR